MGIRTVSEYDASAHGTMDVGTYFEYRDPESDEPRAGFYDRMTHRFTGMSADQSELLTHFRCNERYVRDTLPGSTYA